MVKDVAFDGEAGPLGIKRFQGSGGLTCSKFEKLGIGDEAAAICTTSTREHDDLVASGSPWVKVGAGLNASIDNESYSGLVVVNSFGDEVPLLASTAVAVGDLNWIQVGAEVTAQRIHNQAFSVSSLSGRQW